MRILGQIIKRFFIFVGTVLAIAVTTAALFGARFYRYIKYDVMTSDAVSINLDTMPVNLSSTIYYKNPDTGEFVEWVTLANTENRVWVDGADIPVNFENAMVAIEDERFWTHHGVDFKRTAAASLNALKGEKIFGGSTIAQQLVKNLTGDREVTVKRKLVEICRALKLEQTYGKKEILEWYLNIIYFGRGQYGVGTAAEYYFGKSISQLSLAEMCSIVGVTNNPSKYDPYSFPENNKARQELVLDKMLELGYITSDECQAAKDEPLVFLEHTEREKSGTEVYPYYVDAVIDDVIAYFRESAGVTQEQAAVMLYYGGYDIYACVDMNVQQIMDEFYQNPDNIPKTRDKKDLQSSMVVLDPYSGDILGLEGGVGDKTVARGLNWAASSMARRPPGSSIKPISTYAPAMDLDLISPGTKFVDAKTVKLKGTSWFPKNDGGRNYGTVSVRYGLVHSLNTIAAQVMDRLTPAASYQFLTEKLHMSLDPADQDYAPLAAGQLTVGTTAREMASAYTIFPNMGTYTQGRTFSHIYNSQGALLYENTPVTEQAISDKTAYWITDILQEAVTSGTGRGARLSGMPCAGKTGTTTNAKDRWFVGYTPYYVGAVWTGYAKPARIHVSGNPAATIWKAVMSSLHEGLEWKDFVVPRDVSLPAPSRPSSSSTTTVDAAPEPETESVPETPISPETPPIPETDPPPTPEPEPESQDPDSSDWLGIPSEESPPAGTPDPSTVQPPAESSTPTETTAPTETIPTVDTTPPPDEPAVYPDDPDQAPDWIGE